MSTEEELRAAKQRESLTADHTVADADARAEGTATPKLDDDSVESEPAQTDPARGDSDGAAAVVAAEPAPGVRWWHRDHPTFTALCGFFTGLIYVIVIPGLFAAILGAFFDDETVEGVFPFVLIMFALPIALLVSLKTRRFGKYMLFGMITTAIVVLAVGALTLWILIKMDN